jgi:hypothetical protein
LLHERRLDISGPFGAFISQPLRTLALDSQPFLLLLLHLDTLAFRISASTLQFKLLLLLALLRPLTLARLKSSGGSLSFRPHNAVDRA